VVTLYRQGGINLVLNADPHSFARTQFLEHGVTACAIGLQTEDPIRALNRATALQCPRFDSPIGPNEVQMPAIRTPAGGLIYFVPAELGPNGPFEIDFALARDAEESGDDSGLTTVDHIALGLPIDQLDTWILFCRAVLAMQPGDSLELSDPFGLIRGAAVATADRRVRLVFNASASRRTSTARAVAAMGAGGVHHIALGCRDIFETVTRLRSNGVAFVPISPNYYDDLLARLQIDPELVERLRSLGILYDRTAGGEFFHIYTRSFADHFFFEIVQRTGSYDTYGASNAPARMASQVQDPVIA
jgi:4-hydroxyphenylpyruvate dioxygenase